MRRRRGRAEACAVTLFSSLVLLLFVAAFLLAGSRRLGLPYPAFLCVAGVGVGLLPNAPSVAIEPHLALALFIAPALLDAAYDTSPRELRQLWAPLLTLAVGAVIVTAAVVALVAMKLGGLPLVAAIALGAVVAPPDAAASAAILTRVPLPRHSSLVLQGESLLNDATALLIFGAATAFVGAETTAQGATVGLLIAAPGGILLGIGAGWTYARLMPFVAGALSGIIAEFTATFGVWMVADALQLSPVLAVASYAMMLARHVPARQTARDRVQSYAVWATAVFVLNVLAFLLMGLQARSIYAGLKPGAFWPAMAFAGAILLAVILSRIVCVLGYRAVSGAIHARFRPTWLVAPPCWKTSVLVSWCGMRGLLTLATAFALPRDFPSRDPIVLAAFTVVLGTLVVQGSTLLPLMKLLDPEPDESLNAELADVRRRILVAGLDATRDEHPSIARALRRRLEDQASVAFSGADPQGQTDYDVGLARVIGAQRAALLAMRDAGTIAEDVFHRIELELDWTEVATLPTSELEVGEG